jgi:hypothetical protein
MEATCSSETSVELQCTTWYYIPEDIILYLNVYFNKSDNLYLLFTELLNLFKSKVASPLSLEPVSVAVRFTYVLSDCTGNNNWTQEPPKGELGKLHFGTTSDPVRQVLH